VRSDVARLAILLSVNHERLRIVLGQLRKNGQHRMNLVACPLPWIVAGLGERKHLAVGARRGSVPQEQMKELVVEPTFLLDVDHEPKVVVRWDFELLLFEIPDPGGLGGFRLV
jgi:hypothetical protein